MGFRTQQTKKIWGYFHGEINTQEHCYITSELSSFFLNLSIGKWEQNREREKINGQNDSELNLVDLARFLRNKKS